MRKRIPVVVVVLILAAIGWWAWTTYGSGSAATATLGGSGTIEGDDVMVSAQTSGRVLAAPRVEGDVIKKGELLFRLDPAVLRAQYDQAAAGLRASKAALAQVKDDDASTSADIAAAKAQRDQAIYALKIAKVQLGWATVTAPSAGTLTDKVVDVGENAVAGQTLAVVTDATHLTVKVYIPESLIGQVRIGQKATLVTDSSTKTFDAHVVFIASTAEFTPASVETKDQRVKLVYQVKCAIDNPDGILKPGMPADVTIQP